jgi:hypothetical protein
MLIKMKNNLSKRNYFFQLVARELNLESIDDVMIHVVNVYTTFE